jgi:hypothetical protein
MIYVLHTGNGHDLAFYLYACAELYQRSLGGWIECVDREDLTE